MIFATVITSSIMLTVLGAFAWAAISLALDAMRGL